MKNNIIFFVLGIVFSVCVAATGIGATVFQSAIPVDTIVLSDRSEADLQKAIRDLNKKGYIVKSIAIAGSNSSMYYQIIVVLEKY